MEAADERSTTFDKDPGPTSTAEQSDLLGKSTSVGTRVKAWLDEMPSASPATLSENVDCEDAAAVQEYQDSAPTVKKRNRHNNDGDECKLYLLSTSEVNFAQTVIAFTSRLAGTSVSWRALKNGVRVLDTDCRPDPIVDMLILLPLRFPITTAAILDDSAENSPALHVSDVGADNTFSSPDHAVGLQPLAGCDL
ncbi:uncharacterized protein FMAN_15453 [Fusarium mangiferae]|uniref:Uncharacterized protein n=1 Tax=Fusarium mangiferae TaxID=192010 RepID=A0A1L7UNW5_FUSMA|nr:uncharacterized protein FMAN_15453 [Fusarium mangiferae]CVL09211.1 uncharacterized protein FMAN_15453 [Fusarium mangiferae]